MTKYRVRFTRMRKVFHAEDVFETIEKIVEADDPCAAGALAQEPGQFQPHYVTVADAASCRRCFAIDPTPNGSGYCGSCENKDD